MYIYVEPLKQSHWKPERTKSTFRLLTPNKTTSWKKCYLGLGSERHRVLQLPCDRPPRPPDVLSLPQLLWMLPRHLPPLGSRHRWPQCLATNTPKWLTLCPPAASHPLKTYSYIFSILKWYEQNDASFPWKLLPILNRHSTFFSLSASRCSGGQRVVLRERDLL